ncbi:MAG TPA: circadian clock protein KaiC [Gemmatimonadaceae bacterium]|nr:circadian clock protein KaiC [Gemmatimonadaceae bacterium]
MDAADAPLVKARTGIPGFDEITNGGLPAGRTTLIVGGPGAGKTVFALESLVNAARKFREPGIFVAFEENSRQIVGNAATFGWDLPALEKERLFFLDARLSPTTVHSGDFDITGMLAGLSAKASEMGARRIVFDGIDVLLTVLDNPAKERREMFRLHEWLRSSGLTAVMTAKASESDRFSTERYAFMQFMVDTVVALHHRMLDRVSLRSINIMKYRGSGFAEGEFPLVISSTGIEVATFGSPNLDFDASTERVSTGIARLDTMLDGGYYRGSGVLISGAPGVAKTTIAGVFARAACGRGERVLYVSFDEAGSQIVRNLKSVGVELDSYRETGLLEIYSVRTEARSSEDHLINLKRRIREFRPQNMVIDPLSALSKTGGHIAAVHASLRLLDHARSLGITTVCTSLVANEASEETTATQISTIADTWIHLAYLIHGGERNRTLTIVKSRGMKHSNQVRELLLSDDGLTLADVYTAGGTVLVGTARWEHEARAREADLLETIERRRRRKLAENAQARIRAQIAALEAELSAEELESELLAQHDEEARRRRDRDHSEILRLRHADVDTARESDADPARASASR